MEAMECWCCDGDGRISRKVEFTPKEYFRERTARMEAEAADAGKNLVFYSRDLVVS